MALAYLYGFSVQGIQSFIFETNKLREIVGGSEFVEQSCNFKFKEALGKNYDSNNLIVSAAGKVVYLFEDRKQCEHIVKTFLRDLRRAIPDFNASQAVLELSNGKLEKESLFKLDALLEKQRHHQPMTHGEGWMITERARRTGKAGVQKDKVFDAAGEGKALLDRSLAAKERYKDFGNETLMIKFSSQEAIIQERDLPLDVEDIASKKEGSWLAIVHADGNSLGQTIQQLISSAGEDGAIIQKLLNAFSIALDKATTIAAQRAFRKVVWKAFEQEGGFIPMRPILLGGDDLSLIIRGDLAFDFTRHYLAYFEEETKAQLSKVGANLNLDLEFLKNGLTACAGIAYIKPHYPIHYGVDLAESLTKYCKKTAKKIDNIHVPACLSFHKVQSSFIEQEYEDIVSRELTVKAQNRDDIQFNYGPYFLNGIKETKETSYPSIEQLVKWVNEVQKEDAPKSGLRNWLSELHLSESAADQILKRIKSLNRSRYNRTLDLEYPFKVRYKTTKYCTKDEKKEQYHVTHLYDVLSLASI